jgi:hypothetical protein
MYSPIVAIEVAAAKATLEPREGRERQKERVAASQTVRMGERKRSSTLWKKCGCDIRLFWRSRLGERSRGGKGDERSLHLEQRRTSFSSSTSWKRAHNARRKS